MKIQTFFLLCGFLTGSAAYSQKDYSKWLTVIDIGEVPVKVLRVPEAEFSIARTEIHMVQLYLVDNMEYYQKGVYSGLLNGIEIRGTCRNIQSLDSTFPVHYYQDEARAYQTWHDLYEKRVNEARVARIKKEQDSIHIVETRKRDSIRIAEMKEGYTWINTDSVWVKSTPDSKASNIGKIYRLSYIQGYEVNGKPDWVEIQFGKHTGYILEKDIAYEWEDMLLTEEEELELKKGRYYNFKLSSAYMAKLNREAAAEERAYKAANAQSAAPRRTYITGPRGGCYYINSNGNKTYVDHRYCN